MFYWIRPRGETSKKARNKQKLPNRTLPTNTGYRTAIRIFWRGGIFFSYLFLFFFFFFSFCIYRALYVFVLSLCGLCLFYSTLLFLFLFFFFLSFFFFFFIMSPLLYFFYYYYPGLRPLSIVHYAMWPIHFYTMLGGLSLLLHVTDVLSFQRTWMEDWYNQIENLYLYFDILPGHSAVGIVFYTPCITVLQNPYIVKLSTRPPIKLILFKHSLTMYSVLESLLCMYVLLCTTTNQ